MKDVGAVNQHITQDTKPEKIEFSKLESNNVIVLSRSSLESMKIYFMIPNRLCQKAVAANQHMSLQEAVPALETA